MKTERVIGEWYTVAVGLPMCAKCKRAYEQRRQLRYKAKDEEKELSTDTCPYCGYTAKASWQFRYINLPCTDVQW